MKRKYDTILNKKNKNFEINENFIKNCKNEFNASKINIIAKNVITNVTLSTIRNKTMSFSFATVNITNMARIIVL